ncbi:MAG TPA: peptidyl-prolyl cis-trans isomerase [Opitutus sp.]|nr:peptidyl-prolyl cis-trans isomerase [Opitutus sp.]
MISWIQKQFHQHFRFIFVLVLGLLIVSFIITMAPTGGGMGRGQREVLEQRVFGYNLASQEDQTRLFGDAALSAQLQAGYAPEGAELQNYAFQRAASLSLADQLHIPPTSTQEVSDFIRALRMFSNQEGQFDAARYASFKDSLKHNPSFSEARVSRVIADDVRSGKVQQLLAGPGYVLSSDVKSQLEQADATWTLGVATIDYASFNPSIPVNDATLQTFFDENAFRYEIAPRIEVSYAEFSALQLLPTIHVTDAEVRAYYDSNPSRFPKPAAADPAATPKLDPDADFAAVRPQVETSLKLDRARRTATKAAADFSLALYEADLEPGTPRFDQFLSSRSVTLKTLAPFTRAAGPAEFGGSPEIAAEAFKLNSEHPLSDAVTAPTGAVVLIYKDLQPARTPLLSEVREKVSADYVEGEKRKRFVELGRKIRSTIEQRIKAGDAFDKAVASAASANSVKIESKSLSPFTRRQPPQDIDYSVFGALPKLEKGNLSDMIITKDHGLIVYAADKKLPEFNESSPEFSEARQQIAMASSRMGSSAYLNDLITTELKKSEPPEAK